MNGFWETWGTSLIVLGVGLVAGAVAAWRLMKKGSMGADLEMQLNDLEEQLEHMVSQLKDIELQRARMAESFYVEQKAHYEAKAAELMRARDRVVDELEGLQASGALDTIKPMPTRQTKKKTVAAKTSPNKVAAAKREAAPGDVAAEAPAGFFARNPQLAGALWGAGTVAVVAGLFFSVTAEQTARAPGGSITGNTQPGQSSAPMAQRPAGSDATPIAQAEPPEGQAQRPADPKIQEMMDRVEKDPNDVEAMNYLTGRLVMGGAMPEAERLNKRVLEIEPENVQGKTWAAMIESAKGDVAAAVSALEAIIKEHDDKAADAYFFRGMLAMQGGDQPTMKKYWSRFVEVAPPSPRRERIAQMLQAMP